MLEHCDLLNESKASRFRSSSSSTSGAALPLSSTSGVHRNRGIVHRHALSFSETDAVNMCGATACEVVATLSSCLGVAYSNPTQGQGVWTWLKRGQPPLSIDRSAPWPMRLLRTCAGL